jgi:putative oxidoreductase
MINVGLLILRLVAGLILAAHGAQKLFGWFEGPGFTKLTQNNENQGLRPGWLWASLVILGELGGGLSLAFGFLTPLGAAGICGAMLMAIAKVHWKNGFWNSKRGLEFPLSLLGIATSIGIAGPGLYSLDTLFSIPIPGALTFGILALAAVIVDLVGLYISRPQTMPAQPT